MTIKYPIQPNVTNDKTWDPDRRTICEVLREIYRSASEREDTWTMQRCNEAHDMAKRMAHKLEDHAAQARRDQQGDDGAA